MKRENINQQLFNQIIRMRNEKRVKDGDELFCVYCRKFYH